MPLLGILGGTFDPVHYGHLKPAQDVMRDLELEQVLFIPNNIPPHREPPWLSADQRVQLLEIALADYPGFVLDRRELERPGPSWMVDTLASLAEDYPGRRLCLILGLDAFAGLHRWHRWQRLLELAHLIVTRRPGFSWPQAPELAALSERMVETGIDLQQSRAGKILLKSVTQLDISASEIRRRITCGEDVTPYMPEAVARKLKELIQTA